MNVFTFLFGLLLTSCSELPSGRAVLQDPELNKGLAFTQLERVQLRLRGLLPQRMESIEEQAQRVLWNLERIPENLGKYSYLMNLLELNTELFYFVLMENVEDIMPLVYTPTVGEACQKFDYITLSSRGLWITIDDLGRVEELVSNWPHDDVKAICFTDGERILGLGDLGANGMGIPIGKLALYTALAGIKPSQLVPVVLDVGTDNVELRESPFYFGVDAARERGERYDQLVEEFMEASAKRWGKSTLMQFEDFGNQNSFRLLRKYRDRFTTFNDDIQGTAAVTLAGIYSALRITKKRLSDHVYLFLGAGSAGIGIADLLATAMVAEDDLTIEEARSYIWLTDSKGLIVDGRKIGAINEEKKPYAHRLEGFVDSWSLEEIVKALGVTALLGVSGQPDLITKEVVEAMTGDRPIIFPMSNPTQLSECTAEEAFKWTNGQVLFASGSPFPPLEVNGEMVTPSQANNAYVFPGLALGVISAQVTSIPDSFFLVAARALAWAVADQTLESGSLFPPLSTIREVSKTIAIAVAKHAFDLGLTSVERPKNVRDLVESQIYIHRSVSGVKQIDEMRKSNIKRLMS